MKGDPFGNLMDWGQALERLQEMEEEGALDQAQPGLIRLILYPLNWQVRHRALIAARKVTEPNAQLMVTIADVMADPGCYTDTRVLAAKALGEFADHGAMADSSESTDVSELLGVLTTILNSPEAPILHRAVDEVVSKIKGSRGSRSA
jgi:hypothetical protein